MITGKELDLLGEAYQRRSDEISRKISTKFPEFSRMDVLYVRNFIQENGIPLETAIKNLKDAPMGYVNRIRYSHRLDSCYYFNDNELAIVNRLLNEFDKMEVMEFIRESLDKNKALGKVIADKSYDFNEETAKYLSARRIGVLYAY